MEHFHMLNERISQPEQVDGLHRKTLELLPYMEFQHCNTKVEVEVITKLLNIIIHVDSIKTR